MRKILSFLNIIRHRLWVTRSCMVYAHILEKKWTRSDKRTDDAIVLVEAVDSFPIIHSFSYISNVIARKENTNIGFYEFDDSIYEKLGIPNYHLRYLYRAFGAEPQLSWSDARIFRKKAKIKAQKLYGDLSCKQDLVSMVLDDLVIGDLIYDTYLRKESKFTIDLNDLRLYKYIYQACLIFYTIQYYFKTHNVKAVLPGDVAYIYSGILARFAVVSNINVYTIIEGDGLQLNKMDENFYRRRSFWNYKSEFSKKSQFEAALLLEEAEKALNTRVNGVESNLIYMTKNSFSLENKGQVLSGSDKPKILVLLHCFFDSPHIYRSLLFPDFYEWIVFLLSRANETPYEWYVKPHPNGLPGNEKITQLLKEKFPEIKFLPPSTSNRKISDEGIKAVFTGYGTAGHEFAFLGIPVVNAGDNPHIAYNFNINPHNIDEYVNYIENAGNLDISISKDEVKEFYAMHYLLAKSCVSLQPVYPTKDMMGFIGIPDQDSSKMRRTKYHKSDKTLDYFITHDSESQDNEIISCITDILDNV